MKALKIIFGIAAVATVILPIDLIPDVIPVIGWLDDVLAAGFLLKELMDLIQSKRTPPSN